ncbi:MAG: class I SAM-dependent methyltransferase [Anaerolineaceae bacterium]|nr:class I SAM-dependent methyltransferase [Anaerolineaceae bacterium]
MTKKLKYVEEPYEKNRFTEKYDGFYSQFAGLYDRVIRVLPFWKRWLKSVLPFIEGSKVLEVSFGTGYLLTLFAAKYETYGIDYNATFVHRLEEKLKSKGLHAEIKQANVENLPFENDYFDTIINTMAFTAYPDGEKAMSELNRVLKPGGKLLLVDVAYPQKHSGLGMLLTRLWISMGDIVRDMQTLFSKFNFIVREEEIGGFGSVHLFIAEKPFRE